MADNTTLPGTGDVIADEDFSGVKHQLVKIEWGAAGVANKASAAYPLPMGFVPLTSMLVERVSNTDGASTNLTTFGATAGSANHVTTIVAYNAHATTAGYVDIRSGSGGSVIATLPLPPGGGAVVNFGPQSPLRQPDLNTALAFDVSAAITTVYLTFVGFKAT